MKLANQKQLLKAKQEVEMKDGWMPLEINGAAVHISPDGGTLAVEGLVTLRAGENCIITTQWRVDTDGNVWKRPVIVS